MNNKDLNKAFWNRKNQKSSNKSVVLKCTVTENQEKIIESLVGLIGSNKQDVVGKIVTLWLYKEGYLKLKDGGENYDK
jgi:hypothetical protein